MNSVCIAALVILATLAGCSAPAAGAAFDYSPQYDPAFTDAERAEIAAGFAEWGTPLDYALAVHRVSDDAPNLESCPPEQRGNEDFLGYAFTGSSVCIFVDDVARYAPDDVAATMTQIAAHEYGHALGLRHDESPYASIMHTYTQDDAPIVTAADVAHLKRVEGDASRCPGCQE